MDATMIRIIRPGIVNSTSMSTRMTSSTTPPT